VPLAFRYRWSGIQTQPGAGRLSTDQGWVDTVLEVRLSETSDDGRVPDFVVYDAAPVPITVTAFGGKVAVFDPSGPSVDQGTFRTIPVTVGHIEGTSPANNEDLAVDAFEGDEPAPTPLALERVKAALIQKAARFVIFPTGPLGLYGEMSEWGTPTAKPDYQIAELLKGLHLPDYDVDLVGLITTDDVIRNGLQADPSTFPAERLPDVQRAIDAATDWVHSELWDAWGVA
jgi:hypothetical protein